MHTYSVPMYSLAFRSTCAKNFTFARHYPLCGLQSSIYIYCLNSCVCVCIEYYIIGNENTRETQFAFFFNIKMEIDGCRLEKDFYMYRS